MPKLSCLHRCRVSIYIYISRPSLGFIYNTWNNIPEEREKDHGAKREFRACDCLVRDFGTAHRAVHSLSKALEALRGNLLCWLSMREPPSPWFPLSSFLHHQVCKVLLQTLWSSSFASSKPMEMPWINPGTCWWVVVALPISPFCSNACWSINHISSNKTIFMQFRSAIFWI